MNNIPRFQLMSLDKTETKMPVKRMALYHVRYIMHPQHATVRCCKLIEIH